MFEDELLDALAFQNILPHSVEGMTLVIHDLVVFENVLANQEVAFLDLSLSLADGLGKHRMLDGIPLLHAEFAEDLERGGPCEHLHQIIIETQEEPGGPLVSLSTGSTSQLVVDPSRVMPFSSDHVQATKLLGRLVILETMHETAPGCIQLGDHVLL